MIPVRLLVSNFLPYRDNVPPLSFAGIRTASICGDNGSGKSSLIDAMTWALWGKSRAKSDDDLVHQGQTHMRVEFDFAVGPQVYRIIRQHAKSGSKRGSGQSSLDLLIAADGSFKTISGDRISDTQKKIIDILHMDYETFVNSAFLRQGHADEFTVSRPAERKAVLASILGLSDYDRLEEKAREMAARLKEERTKLASSIGDLDQELARRPAYEAEYAQARSRLADIEDTVAQAELLLNTLRKQRDMLMAKQQQLVQVDEQIADTGRELARWAEQAQQHRLRAGKYEELVNRREAIEKGYASLVSARKLDEDLNQKLRRVTALQERQRQLDAIITQASQSLLREHASIETRISDLQAKHERSHHLRNTLQLLQQEMSRLTQAEDSLRDRRQQYHARVADLSRLESDRDRTEREIREADEKLDLLSTQVGARCPLCERELDAEHLYLIKTKYASERQVKSDTASSIRAALQKTKAELSELDTELTRMEAGLRAATAAVQAKAGLLERQIAEAEEAGVQLEMQKTKLAAIEERLAKKDYALAEQQTWEQLEGQIAALAYDATDHERLRDRLTELERYDGPMRQLEEAIRLLDQEKEAAASAERVVEELQSNLESHRRKRTELAQEAAQWSSVVSELTRAEAEYQPLVERQKSAREAVGSAREKLSRCAQLEVIRKEKEEQAERTAREEGIYRDLAEAFGKKGVQALLIEMAIPEIETEANKLLARMTDNRMHVKFETQRETKKGDVQETLEIHIADDLGTRSYELFSGGEAFRINFAVRIALSRLLARRAGAPLPTLIIDEGFGTQDATGMEKIKEAITTIQDDFEKILVITHIDDFRDAFPVRIDIVKTSEGSTIEIN